ncbi:Protein phosphatase methylesterase 1 [Xanthoria calcicola]
MSELQRYFAKAKLAGLPSEALLPLDTFREEDESPEGQADEFCSWSESAQDEDSSSASSTGTIKPNCKHLFAKPTGLSAGGTLLKPLAWTRYFAQEYYLENVRPNGVVIHHVYLTPPANKGPLFVLHHGAGSSGLSFAVFAAELLEALPDAGVLSIEARGHGETVVKSNDGTIKGEPHDLSIGLLSSDLSKTVQLVQAKLGWPHLPDIVLIGHSLGGAIITDVASRGTLGTAVLGYIVLDVVEGSAVDALQQMNLYLAMRPKTFPSLASAIDWHVRSRTIRNSLSARVSVPPLLYQDAESSLCSDSRPWKWRTDLLITEQYWASWFTGLSKKFLEAKGGKLLILAGTDRLDKELMIGQMQGKYQLQVFPEAGHFIHEDQPRKTAMLVLDFYRRNNRSALILPPKVSQLVRESATVNKTGILPDRKEGHVA